MSKYLSGRINAHFIVDRKSSLKPSAVYVEKIIVRELVKCYVQILAGLGFSMIWTYLIKDIFFRPNNRYQSIPVKLLVIGLW